MKYLVIIEKTPTGFSAYCPDLPGCAATGASRREVERAIQQAIELHLDGLRAEGRETPAPNVSATYVEVAGS